MYPIHGTLNRTTGNDPLLLRPIFTVFIPPSSLALLYFYLVCTMLPCTPRFTFRSFFGAWASWRSFCNGFTNRFTNQLQELYLQFSPRNPIWSNSVTKRSNPNKSKSIPSAIHFTTFPHD